MRRENEITQQNFPELKHINTETDQDSGTETILCGKTSV